MTAVRSEVEKRYHNSAKATHVLEINLPGYQLSMDLRATAMIQGASPGRTTAEREQMIFSNKMDAHDDEEDARFYRPILPPHFPRHPRSIWYLMLEQHLPGASTRKLDNTFAVIGRV